MGLTYFFASFKMTSKLEAINQILQGAGESAFQVAPTGNSDYANAEAILNAETTRVLARGHFFNTDHKYKLTPDANKQIVSTPQMLRVDPSDPRSPYVLRDGKLYDREKFSYEVAEPVECDIVWAMDFEKIPYDLQSVIVAQSRILYQQTYVGSQVLDATNQQLMGMAVADSAAAQEEVEDYNVFDNPDVQWAIRQTPYRRYV